MLFLFFSFLLHNYLSDWYPNRAGINNYGKRREWTKYIRKIPNRQSWAREIFFSFREKRQQDNDFWASAISLSLSSSIFLTIPTLSLLSSSFPYSRVLIQSSSFPFPHNSPVFSVHVLSLSFLVHSKYSSIPSPFFPVLVLSLTVPLTPYLSLSIPSLFLFLSVL